MQFTIAIAQLLNGIALGMLLFLLAAGLSLMFGLMGIVNLAHGSYFMIGGYVLAKGTVVFESTPGELEHNEEVKKEYLAI